MGEWHRMALSWEGIDFRTGCILFEWGYVKIVEEGQLLTCANTIR